MTVRRPPTRRRARARRSPYQGLVPYTEADADWFFGRDEWREIIRARFRSYRITVLYGSSGVGKSSVLRAGLMRRLEDEAREHLAEVGRAAMLPVYFADWSLDQPIDAVRDAVARSGVASLALDRTRRRSRWRTRSPRGRSKSRGAVLLVLDQLEELFVYHERPGGPRSRGAGGRAPQP